MTPEFTSTVVTRVTNRSPFRVAFGEHERHEAYFATFDEAVKFGRALRRAWDGDPCYSIGLYNDAVRDPLKRDDTGLMLDQWEEWSHGE